MTERLRPAAWAFAMIAAAAGSGAQAEQDERVERRRIVEGWLVEQVDEMDGGIMVRMNRQGRFDKGKAYRLMWWTSYWRGNGGPIRGAELALGDCASGEPGSVRDARIKPEPDEVRARFSLYLAECRATAIEAAAVLEGFGAAFTVAEPWMRETEAFIAAENEAIANYGASTEADTETEMRSSRDQNEPDVLGEPE